jgi:hypothetical protein
MTEQHSSNPRALQNAATAERLMGELRKANAEIARLREELTRAKAAIVQGSALEDSYIKECHALRPQIERLRAALQHIADWPTNQLDGVDAARVAKTALGPADETREGTA